MQNPRAFFLLLALIAVGVAAGAGGAAATQPTAASGTIANTSATFNSIRDADGNLIVHLSAHSAAAFAAEAPAWRVVALGDSGASGNGDPTRLAWSGRYARLLRQRLHHKVVLTNLAAPGKSSRRLLRELRNDPATRATVRRADIILFGSTAGANLNEADANYDAGRCKPKECYTQQLTPWAKDFEAIVATSRSLRGRKKTVLRGVTDANVVPGAQDVLPPNATVELGLFQARTINTAICASLREHRGRCIDVLAAFNGPSGAEDAYAKGLMNKVECCYASGKGQQLIAELLFKSGLKPLR